LALKIFLFPFWHYIFGWFLIWPSSAIWVLTVLTRYLRWHFYPWCNMWIGSNLARISFVWGICLPRQHPPRRLVFFEGSCFSLWLVNAVYLPCRFTVTNIRVLQLGQLAAPPHIPAVASLIHSHFRVLQLGQLAAPLHLGQARPLGCACLFSGHPAQPACCARRFYEGC
jgi:hypothetical protein